MMGINVTLLRTTTAGLPIVRYFEGASDWIFANNLLSIIQELNEDSSTESKKIIIAEFLKDSIEGVEFAIKETA